MTKYIRIFMLAGLLCPGAFSASAEEAEKKPPGVDECAAMWPEFMPMMSAK